MTVSVRVPATSANLGPGFDACGLALAWYDEVTATLTDGPTAVSVSGEGAGELPTGAEHLVVRALHAGFAECGMDPPPVALSCMNRIPQARGLGSSSAAIVAGLLLARGLMGQRDPDADRLDDRTVLRLATGLEGHPDNVAACLLGGFTIAWLERPDRPRAVRMDPAATIGPTAFVPDEHGLTASARAALPANVPHGDAAHTAGRAALLVPALASGVPELLLAATEDRLHQDYRAAAAPESAALLARLRSAGIPAVISGAGPSVLALAPVPAGIPLAAGWVDHVLEVDHSGATVQTGTITAYTGEDHVTRRDGPVLPQVGRVV